MLEQWSSQTSDEALDEEGSDAMLLEQQQQPSFQFLEVKPDPTEDQQMVQTPSLEEPSYSENIKDEMEEFSCTEMVKKEKKGKEKEPVKSGEEALTAFIAQLKPAPPTKPNVGHDSTKAKGRVYKPRDKSGMPFARFRQTIAPLWVKAVMHSENKEQDKRIIQDFQTKYPTARKWFNANSMWAIRHGFTFIQYSGVVPAKRPAPKPRTKPYRRLPNFTTEKVNLISSINRISLILTLVWFKHTV